METLFNLPPEYKQTKLKTLPLRDQPSFRVASNAIGCNLAELLAAVVGGSDQIEIADGLLARFEGNITRIHQAYVAELASVEGIGPQIAVRLKAAMALGIRLQEPTGERQLIDGPGDAAALVQYEKSLLETEHLRVMLLATRYNVYHGSVNSSQVRISEVFRPAVQRNSPALIDFKRLIFTVSAQVGI